MNDNDYIQYLLWEQEIREENRKRRRKTREENKARRRRRNRLIGCVLLLLFVLMAAMTMTAESEEIHKVEEIVDNQIELANYIIPEEDDRVEEPDEQIEIVMPETVDLGEFKTTAYCACVKCCGIWSAEHPSRGADYVQKTASGTIPEEGRTIAADWDVLPKGTEVMINGNTYTVEDTGSGVNGKHIDVFFDNHEEAREWGIQFCDVEIICERSDDDVVVSYEEEKPAW